MKKMLLFSAIALLFIGCSTKSDTLKVNYICEGILCSEVISLDFIGDDNRIRSPYIDSVGFCYLDSLSYPDNNPDHYTQYTTPYKLDFSKTIEPYSQEYYCAYTVHNIIKVIEYYNRLFDNKIDFNAQEKYRTIDVAFGDASMLTHPNFYIFEENSNPSPTLFAHEIGHRAFWYLEDPTGIKFNGLSLVHMGLLEYFTVSLYDTPLVGEGCLPVKTVRDASVLHKYPIDSTYNLRHTFKLLEESYPAELQNPKNNISKYLSTSYAYYGDDILDKYYDNHRGAMILTGTLWRIREQMGQEDTDKLIAQTIMNLNVYMDKRNDFFISDINSLPDQIDWCDVFYGLIQKDKELYDGKNIQTIVAEFTKTGYPVDLIKY
ncbi:MAG: hypothetical protein LBJ63_03395 [Prevotellaceae bacterium]|jgi:hypothetical protein|nr:hypothetical protein [Prevotellaceae bacterium]